MLEFNGFDHINLSIKNFAETLDFYKKVFGFQIVEEKEYDGRPYATMGISGKGFLCLYEADNDFTGNDGINHIGININNYEQVIEQLKKLGIPYKYGGHVNYPHSRSIYIEDPNGIEIEISEKFGGDH